ncbi:MAG: hypothetical protein KME03_07010 [Aphanocapsa lilacina HA4352-LM1]|nr:hypothetical protein [Aphanocapsa lilacina HA4352-LM1]
MNSFRILLKVEIILLTTAATLAFAVAVQAAPGTAQLAQAADPCEDARRQLLALKSDVEFEKTRIEVDQSTQLAAESRIGQLNWQIKSKQVELKKCERGS